MKYFVVCKYCGRTVYKTEEALALVLKIEIECPDCGRFLKLPEEGIPKVSKEIKPGLEMA